MRRKRTLAALLAVLTLLPLTGCWDRTELEEAAFVLAIGVDKGKESIYTVTFAIAHPGRMAGGGKGGGGGGGGGGGEDEKPLVVTSVEAPTVAAAISMADTYLSRQVSLRHTKALFMGEELARISGMFTMDEFVRFRQARRTMFYIVTKGKASDFLSDMKPELEKDPQRFIEQMTYNVRYTGMIPSASQIQHFVTQVNTGYTEPITYYAALKEEDEEKGAKATGLTDSGYMAGELPRTGGANIELLGGAAFKGEHMVGILNGEDMRMVLLLQDKFKRGLFSIADPRRPEVFVSMEIHQGRPLRIDTDLSGPRPRIHALVTLEGELLSIQSANDYTEPELQAELERATVAAIEGRMITLVRKTQEWNTDAVGFGESVVKEFPTVAAWENYRWPDRYRDAEIKVDVRFTLRRFGKQLSPPRPRTEQ
ncbi:MAG TPA: Ger(x)C family spore germination protein [Symbiobacteriaceae bacterium]|nr:Ger(x)C family spore germination protein [Symbiobacteriaceae bacterium]